MDSNKVGYIDIVEKYMKPVSNAMQKHIKWPSAEYTEIYNRAWEAVYNALKDQRANNG